MDPEKYLRVGQALGFSGKELQDYVEKEQKDAQRDARGERAELLELKRQEKEILELQLELAKAKQDGTSDPGGQSSSNRSSARTPKLPAFNDGKDDIDAYLHRFERYAIGQGWKKEDWAMNLSALLSGKALDVYSRLPDRDASDFDELKAALLQRYDYTAEGFRNKLFTSKPEAGETGHQYAARIGKYFDRWIKLAGIKENFVELRDLIIKGQFVDGCSKELSLFLRERQPSDLETTAELTEQYLTARGGMFTQSGSRQIRNQDRFVKKPEGKIYNSEPKGAFANQPIECYNCHRNGHLARNCTVKPMTYTQTSPNMPKTCYLCHKPGHFARNCNYNRPRLGAAFSNMNQTIDSNASPHMQQFRTYPEQSRSLSAEAPPFRTDQGHAMSYVPNELRTNNYEYLPGQPSLNDQSSHTDVRFDPVASCMEINDSPQSLHSCCLPDNQDHITLQCGHSLPIVSAACNSKVNIDKRMPVTKGIVGNKQVSVLRDSGCSSAVIRQSLVLPEQMTGKETTCILIDGTVRKVPVARIHVDTPYLVKTIDVLCMKNPLYDLILGNVQDILPPDHPDLNWTPTTQANAVQTRNQVKNEGKPLRPLKVPKPLQDVVTPEKLKDAQQTDESLRRARELADSQQEKTNNRNATSSYYYRDGILFRKFHSPNVEHDSVFHQVVVPKSLRTRVMRLAHETLFGGHQGAKKTTDKILTNFFWPGITSDVTRYCQSCDVCQRTLPKGKVTRVPLGTMPLIEIPFQRIAVDIVGPIQPMTERRNRYILTIVDYATRYPEAIPLPSIEAERVAEALVSVFTRVGIPSEMLTDQGSQFTSEVMNHISRLLSIKQITTSPYHPIANGLVERFNGTLKQMLKRMCAERPSDWDRYVEPLLFAIRESPQESLGFSPFELLYGRKVRGPMAILKELWTGNVDVAETKTTYEYVLELRNRLEETCQEAHRSLQKSATRYKKQYDKKSKVRSFVPGDKVLLLLPTDRSKLLLQWKGPFNVIAKIGASDYRIDLNGKTKVFHINLLKKYNVRQDEVSSLSHPLMTLTEPEIVATAVIECEEDTTETSLSNKALLQPFPLDSQETVADVTINQDLTSTQRKEINQILTEFQDTLTDLPGRTTLGHHDIKLTEDEPRRSKPYPIPHALRQTVKDEVQKMLALGVIEPSNSPFASPIVLVKKPDGSNRFCVDYRRLNQITVFDAEPIPDQEELFTKLSHARYFTKLDLSKGYWQVPMSESAKHLTAFLTPDGLFQFTMMPFGLVNAPATFSRLMRKALEGLHGTLNYIDDILIYSSTWSEHVQALKELFQRLRAANLTAKPSKCHVAQEQVEFLGHVIGKGELAPRPQKVTAINEISKPQTKKQLRSFLGTTNYYRKFIPNYSAIAAPLTDKLKNSERNQVIWGENEEQAFHTLKSKLSNFPILRLPDLTKKFVLRTDASDNGIGAVLLQKHANEKFPVAYASRKLKDSEKDYAVIEKECLAIIWAVKKFETYLYGNQFDLETDHQSLTYIHRTKVANPMVMRWALALQPYRFRLVSIKGSDNVGADLLSRL
ncbi:uncharacterized protein LOC121420251 [Lytechinus variegatus]|uniref:uncharacterized protein LOC121420251 n=1 Tax=Lytechinus variegatus TaxID=7654 RepID=UPI001BB21DF9|nr:uncharacterized protein LOC121420251 [Lytechinus variegatus]